MWLLVLVTCDRWHATQDTWDVTCNTWHGTNEFFCINATIRTCQEIQCLLIAGFLLLPENFFNNSSLFQSRCCCSLYKMYLGCLCIRCIQSSCRPICPPPHPVGRPSLFSALSPSPQLRHCQTSHGQVSSKNFPNTGLGLVQKYRRFFFIWVD